MVQLSRPQKYIPWFVYCDLQTNNLGLSLPDKSEIEDQEENNRRRKINQNLHMLVLKKTTNQKQESLTSFSAWQMVEKKKRKINGKLC